METVFYFLASFIAALLDIISFAMMARVILSLLFMGQEDGKFMIFLVCITEPFILPVRFLLAKFNLLQDSPIDWSFSIAYVLLVIIRMALPAI